MSDVFETRAWFDNLQAHGFEASPRVVWLQGSDESKAKAFDLPLMRLTGFAPKLTSLSNYYSSLYGPVGECKDATVASWQALGQALRQQPSSAVVQLQPLDSEGAFIRGISLGLNAAGYWVDRYFCFGNWYLQVAGRGFDEYFAGLPSALRHSVERGRRRLAREGAFELSIQIADDEGLTEAIAAFEQVYRQSWKQAEPCVDFMPKLIRTAATEGWLRLGVLRLHGMPVAAQLWLVKEGKANIYKLAYVQGYERFSPGSVLTAALMQHALDVDHVSEVDYLTGDDAYKRDWMSHRRERVGLAAFDPHTLTGLIAAVRHFGGRWFKSCRQTVRV